MQELVCFGYASSLQDSLNCSYGSSCRSLAYTQEPVCVSYTSPFQEVWIATVAALVALRRRICLLQLHVTFLGESGIAAVAALVALRRTCRNLSASATRRLSRESGFPRWGELLSTCDILLHHRRRLIYPVITFESSTTFPVSMRHGDLDFNALLVSGPAT